MNWTRFKGRSLKTRITLFTLTIFLVSIWSLAFYSSQTLRADMERLLGDQQLSTVSLLADELNHELGDRLAILARIASRITPAMLANTTTLQAFLAQSLTLEGEPFNAGIIVHRLDGTAVAEFPPAPERLGVNYTDIDSVATALQEGKLTISRPVIGKKLQAPVFGMTVAIRDPRDHVIGAVSGVVNLAIPNFLDHITDGRYGKTGGFLLVAPQYRQIITATDKSRVMAHLPSPGVNPTIDRFIEGFEGPIVFVSSVGTKVLSSARRIPVSGWDMVAILPTAEAFAPIRAMQQRMLLAALLLTLLAAAATWWILDRQLAPMLSAAKLLSHLSATQQLPKPLPIARHDEVGELIASFNHLVDSLGNREKALQESEAFKNTILNSMAAEIVVLDQHGVIQAVNKRWRRFSRENSSQPGQPAAHTEAGTNYLAFCTLDAAALADDAANPRLGIEAVLERRLPSFSLEYACHSPQELRWFTMTVMPLGPDIERGVVITHSDITAVKRAEQYEQFRGRILQLLAEGEPLHGILEALAQGVEELNPGMLCSILLVDNDGQRLTTGAAPSLPDSFNAAVNGMKIRAAAGSCGTAAFTGQRVIVEDIATHPYWERARELAASAGLRSCWSEPVRSSPGKVIGTFAIYHRHPHSPSAAHIELIEQSARLASIAIERNLAAERLRTSEAHYRLLTENVADIVWRQDRDHYFTYISPADERLRGYKAEQVIGRHVTEVLTAEGIAILKEKQALRAETERRGVRTGITRFELPQRCQDGSLIWLEVLSTPERDAQGTIIGYHGVSREITERKYAEDQVRKLAFHDPLTALPNRRLLNDRLQQTMAASGRAPCHGAVMFVDLDNFKPLNDAHGHVIGDLLLVEAAGRLKSCVREVDTVARFGGDEFVVMISELAADKYASMEKAAIIAEKIRVALREPYRLSIPSSGQCATTLTHRCSASIGVALFIGHQATQDEILQRADAAMYEAKQAGRNFIRFYDGEQRGREPPAQQRDDGGSRV
ncbi:diguanylate cyclase [Candidatus Accumulibacter phosphatis]|uniref:Diguanylate cyclase n=1 Tax=Candidatus Accumulibacter phosphatis TaxID=327160 RepID=A0ABX1TWN0_9PROT|nr:diguanylate cyclase [Candidatus Accumulibacter phosphatis]